MTLHWAVSGAPDPSVVWEHEERKVGSSGRIIVNTENGVTSLTITEVVRSDEGVYTCCALNSLGSEIRECKVILLGEPQTDRQTDGYVVYNVVHWLQISHPFHQVSLELFSAATIQLLSFHGCRQ